MLAWMRSTWLTAWSGPSERNEYGTGPRRSDRIACATFVAAEEVGEVVSRIGGTWRTQRTGLRGRGSRS